MIKTFQLQPGITLRCCQDDRFKTGSVSLQLVRPMCREEASHNALLSAVLLRGTEKHPDMRDITLHLDDLYGATVGSLIRKVGDYQTTGFYCSFTEDRFALPGDRILEPAIAFLQELLYCPRLENGLFFQSFLEGERRNLLSAIEAQKNDKRVYAGAQLMKHMCALDPSGVPRLGETERIREIANKELFDHYQKILRESRIDLFYVGSRNPEEIAEILTAVFADADRNYLPLPEQTGFRDGGDTRNCEMMDVTQGKLQMGFIHPGGINSSSFVPMQVLNTVFGGGMTSKLFMNIREKMSLCYDIGSAYQGSKGILTVAAGMDCGMAETVEQEVLKELEKCRRGEITQIELTSAKQSLISSLRGIHDSPGAIENYYATGALSGLSLSVADYMRRVEETTVEMLSREAQKVRLHSVYLLKGVQ